MNMYMPPTMNKYMNPVRRMVFAPAALQEIPQKRDFSFDVGESKNGKLLCVLLNEHQRTSIDCQQDRQQIGHQT